MGIQWPEINWKNPYPPGISSSSAREFLPASERGDSFTSPYRIPQQSGTFVSPGGYPIQMHTLRNGHRVLIEQRPTDIISLRTFINAGSIDEDPLLASPLYGRSGLPPGIAHLDEHCHFLTTENFPVKNSWVRAAQRLGARLNASTSSEIIQHEMAFNREDTASAISLHAESVLRPLYKPDDVTQEKTAVINEMGERKNVSFNRIENKMSELMFERPEFQTLGNREDVTGTTSEELKRFHSMFYIPSNMVTVISGRVNPSQVINIMEQEFGRNPPRPLIVNKSAIRLALRQGEIRYATISDPQLTYSVVNLGFPAPQRANLKERMAMEFIADLLGGGSLSILQSSVKEKQRLASHAEASYTPMMATGQFSVILHTNPGSEQQTALAALNSIADLSRWQVTEEKLLQTRNRLIYDFKANLNDVELATGIMGGESLSQSLPYYLNYIELANSIRPEDILQAARKYLNPNSYALVYGVPEARERRNSPFPQGGEGA